MSLQGFRDVPPLPSARLDLEPLRVEHADEMAPLLDDPLLHAFIGGEPASLADLRERYRRQAAGHSREGDQRWLNWVVRRRTDGRAVGTAQTTTAQEGDGAVAEVAWVIATPYQGRGYAREAAGTMVAWLRQQGVAAVVANVHPDHEASQKVASAVGLTATTTLVDGEVRWQPPGLDRSRRPVPCGSCDLAQRSGLAVGRYSACSRVTERTRPQTVQVSS